MKRLNWMGKLCLSLLAVGLFFGCEMGVDGDSVATSDVDTTSITSKATSYSGEDLIGCVVAFKGANGYYVVAERDVDDNPLQCDRSAIGSWEKYTVVDAGDGDIAFISDMNDNYVCADRKYTGTPLMANRTAIGTWETFEWIDHGDGTCSIYSPYFEKYWKISGDDDDDNSLSAGANTMWSNAIFEYTIVSGTPGDGSDSDYPTQVLGITEDTWKINSFVGDPDDDPTYYDDITDSGVDYDTYSDDNYFYTDGEWAYFKCYRGLGGSDNSSNPRVELREMDGSGDEEYWTNEGTNTMEWTVRVDQLSTDADGDEGVTCFGQIHGPGDSVDDIIRVQFKGDASQSSGAVDLKISGYITEDVMGSSQILDDTYYLDTEYTFKIEYNSDDYVTLYCDGDEIFSQKMDTDEDDNYFKVGNYIQQSKDADYDGSYAIVAVKDLTITHE
ncbi:MAG: polysaccharide lyase family 7 protein [Spirochaetales bacterium]|nr:polysaccharide lyase family 7 protein [Spirochaetales bacterium]